MVHQHFSVEKVFRLAALSVFVMFFACVAPVQGASPLRRGADRKPRPALAKNFLTVASNGAFMLFLIIFSGYYIAFWQEFIVLSHLYP